MAQQTVFYLKTRFESGDIPTQQDFADLIDTLNNPLPETVVQTDANGVITTTNNILPSANSTLDIGSPTARFKTIYVDEAKLSANTLYIGDTPILGTNADTIEIKADPDQSILIKTSGVGETGVISASGINVATNGINADVLIQANGVGSMARISSETSAKINAPLVELTGEISSVGNQNISGNLTVAGNLTINGTQTTVNSTTVTTADNIITINKGEAGTGVTSGFAGIQVDRGEAVDYQMVFNESIDMFQVGMVGSLETIASQNHVSTNYTPISHSGSVGTGAHGVATGSLAGFMSAADKSKLDAVASGAQVNTVDSVAGKTGVVTLVKADVGLGSVDNTTDLAKPVSTATQTALNLKANLASPTFTGTVVLPSTTSVGTVTSTELGYLDGVTSAIQTQINTKAPLASPTFTGTVVLPSTTSVGTITSTELGYLDGVTSAIQTQINTKAPLASPTFTGTVAGITKTMVGLGSVDNTADAAKNVLSATKLTTSRTINGVAFDGTANITIATADATKLPLTGGTLTGSLSGTHIAAVGTGNDYHVGGFESTGNGASNTVFPTYGFHQPGLYAASIQLRGGTDFRFYSQGATAYANISAATVNAYNVSVTGTTATVGTLYRGTTPTDVTTNLAYNGNLYASKVYNAVFNDIADFVELDEPLEKVEYGKCYVYKNDQAHLSSEYCEKGILGICSDTFGYGLGKKNLEEGKELPIAVGGFVLAYVENVEELESGDALTCTANGYLTKMDKTESVDYPERIVGTFFRKEKKEEWYGIMVDGRVWVKVK